MLTYFWKSPIFLFLFFFFFTLQNVYFCQSAFVIQTNNSPTVVNAKNRSRGACLEFVKTFFTL